MSPVSQRRSASAVHSPSPALSGLDLILCSAIKLAKRYDQIKRCVVDVITLESHLFECTVNTKRWNQMSFTVKYEHEIFQNDIYNSHKITRLPVSHKRRTPPPPTRHKSLAEQVDVCPSVVDAEGLSLKPRRSVFIPSANPLDKLFCCVLS